MCGICGFISCRDISLEQLKRMNDTMMHRGPDDGGEEIFPLRKGFHVGLAQRRLSILDLSEQGHQPMHSAENRVSMVFNGEIYNYLELKEELSGYPFKSNCDTEVILAAYQKWGIGCVERLNGMFAIALWDRKEEVFYLIRDRIGKKPLYYQIEKGNLYFASTLKPLMARPGFQKTINVGILPRYLYQSYINHPDSIFSGVSKLEPGAILRIDLKTMETFSAAQWKYWDIKTIYHEMRRARVNNYAEAKEELKRLIKKAVSMRMISDVPLGAFLSGGYDSSLVVALAMQGAVRPVKTFSIGFSDEKYNEAGYAKEVANYLGTDHTEAYITEKEMFTLVDSIPQYYDEPFADSSQIPTMLVSELAKRKVTAVLSGDGGDEFFCGYSTYVWVRHAQLLDFPGGIIHGIGSLPGLQSLKLIEKLPYRVGIIASNRNPETQVQACSDGYLSSARSMIRPDSGTIADIKYPVEKRYQVRNWQIRRMLLDMDTYLPGDILCKVDRASMKYSLETRCPLLDKNVMEYSFRLAHSFKGSCIGGNKNHNSLKRILKDITYDLIPRELLERPKTGFAVPLDKWLRGPLREQLSDLCGRDFLKKQGIFNTEYTPRFIENYIQNGDGGKSSGTNYSKLVWSFFVFQKWWQEWRNNCV